MLARSRAIPWLGEFRVVLDPEFPVRVDDRGVEIAARHARELRDAGLRPAEGRENAEEVEELLVEVG